MKIGNIIQAFKIEAAAKRKTKTEAAASSPSTRDTVSISPQAKSLQQVQTEVRIAKDALKSVPDVREGVLEEVSSRIRSGYYNSSEFRNALAERLSGPLSEDVANTPSIQAGKSIPEASSTTGNRRITPNRLTEIRERISDNYYSDNSVKSDIADKILKNMGL